MPPTEEDIAWFRSTFHPIPRPALPDDCIEYSLYIVSPSLDVSHDSELRLQLREVQKYATEIHRQRLKDYIWQRQEFSVELQKEDGEVGTETSTKDENKLTLCLGLSFLRGRTEYGDSVEDEWVIVWLLRELTKKFKDLWVKVTDTDGEFLLIEASGTLPSWLEPDVAENRVWINDGQLRIIKPANDARTSKRTQEKLTLEEARKVIESEPKRLMHSISMEEEAFFRLRNYPAQISDNMHYAIVTLPRKVAHLIHQKPAYIAPAVEAFYLRDPIALKPLQSKDYIDTMLFAPRDFVTVSVKFPRVAYAQIKSQEFLALAVFAGALPAKSDSKAYIRAETGMKITCGFEMLISDSQHQDRPAVREIKMLLEDLDSGDEVLPTDDDIQKWEQREGDEKWMDINFEDLEKELGGQRGEAADARGKKPGFGDKAARENLQRIVKQFEEFLNDDKAGVDGAGFSDGEDEADDLGDEELDSNDDDDNEGEDKDASFGEDDFTKMMQEMMGIPPDVMKEMMSGKLGPGAEDPASRSGLRPFQEDPRKWVSPIGQNEDEHQEDGDMEKFMKEMEAELRGHGALDLGSSSKGGAKQKTVTKSTAKAGKGPDEEIDEEHELSSDDEIDVNLARNLLESLKAQAGTAGPGGNLMGMFGLSMPRDEDGDSDHDDQLGPGGVRGIGEGKPRITELK